MPFLERKGIAVHLNQFSEPVVADGPQEKKHTVR